MISWSDDHRELHGFSTELGTWSKIPIEEQDIITPVVADHVAAVSLKDAMAAYAKKGVLDVLTVMGSKAVPVVSRRSVKVQDGMHHYTFAASSGRWTSPTDDSLTIEQREFFVSHLDP
ncbi:MAG: hypothetical protein R3C49_14495 [Planctomycetaceae bacterium]